MAGRSKRMLSIAMSLVGKNLAAFQINAKAILILFMDKLSFPIAMQSYIMFNVV